MKTALIIFVTISIIMGISSCSKDKTVVSPTSSDPIYKTAVANTTYHDNGAIPGVEGQDYGCWGAPTNCLPEVVISPNNMDGMTNFFNVVSKNDSGDIISYVQANYTTLSSYFGGKLLDSILDGTYTVVIRGSIANGTAFIVIMQGSTVISVHPFIQ